MVRGDPVRADIFPTLITGNRNLDQAFRIALGDVVGNILPFQGGLLAAPEPAIIAGLDYVTPWTRDAAINVWNGCGLLMPEASRATLLSVLERIDGELRIGGQYWDAIIWVIGAWWYHLYTGDTDFLRLALDAAVNSLRYFESTEFDQELGLFRGGAFFQDGIAGYPDIYTKSTTSCIHTWVAENPGQKAPVGFGLPMHALSTNCLYYEAYRLTAGMEQLRGVASCGDWLEKAARLKEAINKHFWNDKTQSYRYLIDPFGGCDFQEGAGHSFALLFGIAEASRAAAVLDSQHISAAGIPCVWPTFDRYHKKGGIGRHSGTVWPQVQALWASAAASTNRPDRFAFELFTLAEHACRDAQFTEIYHPVTRQPYGGLQEYHPDRDDWVWESCKRQTWSATGYLRMILHGLLGLVFEPDSLRFQPSVPDSLSQIRMVNLPYRNMRLDIEITGSGNKVATCEINGELRDRIAANDTGDKQVKIEMKA